MSMELFQYPCPHETEQKQLRLLCAYENGGVTMWGYANLNRPTSVEGFGWEHIWTVKLHVETGRLLHSRSRTTKPPVADTVLVMAMSVSRDKTIALTVSADHIVGRYDLHVRRLLYVSR